MTKTPKSFKTVLKHIDAFLGDENISYYERKCLWDVLTALRGPDSEDPTLKAATTQVVRYTALPQSGDTFALSGPDALYNVDVRKKATRLKKQHFTDHQESAFRALGLKWHEGN